MVENKTQTNTRAIRLPIESPRNFHTKALSIMCVRGQRERERYRLTHHLRRSTQGRSSGPSGVLYHVHGREEGSNLTPGPLQYPWICALGGERFNTVGPLIIPGYVSIFLMQFFFSFVLPPLNVFLSLLSLLTFFLSYFTSEYVSFFYQSNFLYLTFSSRRFSPFCLLFHFSFFFSFLLT